MITLSSRLATLPQPIHVTFSVNTDPAVGSSYWAG